MRASARRSEIAKRKAEREEIAVSEGGTAKAEWNKEGGEEQEATRTTMRGNYRAAQSYLESLLFVSQGGGSIEKAQKNHFEK